MLVSIFLQQALNQIPSSGNSGYDLVIILVCLAVLTGMVYLFKFVLEKCGVARRRDLISSTGASHSSENQNP
jgi:hypothetical protein